METKQIVKYVGLGFFALIGIIMLFMSWEDVPQGSEGFDYRPYSGGVDVESHYAEGTYFVAPWNDIVSYDIRQQSRSYESQVMDINGTDIGVVVAVNYHAEKGSTAKLHLKHGTAYAESFIDKKVKGAIKDVIGRYTYVEVYSTKREALEVEIEEILTKDFEGNYVMLDFVEIADVNLPKNIATEITNKETQKQKNMTSELKKIEEKNLADAKIETARGDSAKLMINSTAEAASIEIKQKQLRQSPQYIEYMKAKKWDGKMPTVVSGNGGGLIIDLGK